MKLSDQSRGENSPQRELRHRRIKRAAAEIAFRLFSILLAPLASAIYLRSLSSAIYTKVSMQYTAAFYDIVISRISQVKQQSR